MVGSKYVEIQNDFYDGVKIVNEEISAIEGVKDSAVIAGNGSANISIVTDANGNVAEGDGLIGTIEGNFENEIKVNGKAIQISGASSIKVATDSEIVTEILNVAGDLVTTNGATYRKDVRVILAR